MADYIDRHCSQVVGGKKYNTRTATHVCSGPPQTGMQAHLYKTRKGAYFIVNCSNWQNDRDRITPVDEDRAREFAEPELTVKDFEEFFGAVEDA